MALTWASKNFSILSAKYAPTPDQPIRPSKLWLQVTHSMLSKICCMHVIFWKDTFYVEQLFVLFKICFVFLDMQSVGKQIEIKGLLSRGKYRGDICEKKLAGT